jgi:hypothetical protein
MRFLVAGLLVAIAPVLRAQDSTIVIDPNAPPSDSVFRGGPPAAIVEELIAFYNDSATTRLQGDVSIPRGSAFEGRLAVHRGALRIAGHVRGPIAVANGTLYLLPGADVEGDILVVGGRLVREGAVQHRGTERVYWDATPIGLAEDGRLVLRERRRSLSELATARTSFQTGRVRTTLTLGTVGTYNLIEGLPIFFGPAFEYHPARRALLRADIRGIIRTTGDAAGLRSDFGYIIRTDMQVLGSPTFGVEGRLYNVVEPIEDQPLSPSEIGWSAVLLQRDYRDYFERQGIGGSFYVQPAPSLRFDLSLRRDAERSVRAADPWSLLRNTDRWRRNPLIDDGHYITAGIAAEYDTRNEREFPSSGWLIRARYEHSTSNDVAPVTLPTAIRPPVPVGGGYNFDRLALDVRRYLRLTPELRLNARVRADGWATGDRLPVQRRVSLGGPDLLPGYRFRDFACGQPDFPDPAMPALCDRMIGAQLEVRTRLRLNLGRRLPAHEAGRAGMFLGIEEADLVMFTDAGKAWLAGDGPGQVDVHAIPVLDEWKYDIGVGLDAGEVGVYVAKGFSQGEPVHFFVRLRRRF